MNRALRAALNAHWAMEPNALRNLLRIAARQNPSIEVVQAELGRPLQNSRTVTIRDGVACVPITGPIFRYASFFTAISGASSVDQIAADFSIALTDPSVQAIILEVDSPGGEVGGIADLARMIFDARGQKPTVAFVDGEGASAGYWLASAAERVVAADTSIVGSIGVRATLVDYSEADKMAGIEEIEIVSSQSPRKAFDPGSEDTRAQVQALIDDLADVFVGAVAQHRGVPVETVLSDFGQGGVFVGRAAVDAGLADEVGTFESLLAELSENRQTSLQLSPAASGHPRSTTEATMAEKTEDVQATEAQEITAASLLESHPQLVDQFRAEGEVKGEAKGAEAERNRIVGILELKPEASEQELVLEMARDPKCDAGAAAMRLRTAASDRRLAVLRDDEKELNAPAPSQDASEKAGSGAAAVLAAYRKVTGEGAAASA